MSKAYRSTRSTVDQSLSFEDAVMMGLAKDGGLFIPSVIPQLPKDFVSEWKHLSFQQLALKIMSLYVDESEISSADLETLIEKSYSTFRSHDVTPVKVLDKSKNLYLLELFHGPTYAFKDVAL